MKIKPLFLTLVDAPFCFDAIVSLVHKTKKPNRDRTCF
jgi:hypothetical protein